MENIEYQGTQVSHTNESVLIQCLFDADSKVCYVDVETHFVNC